MSCQREAASYLGGEAVHFTVSRYDGRPQALTHIKRSRESGTAGGSAPRSKMPTRVLWPVLLLILLPSFAFPAEISLVEDGVAQCVIVAPPTFSDLQRLAVDDFRNAIRRASGAEIPVLSADEARNLPKSTVRILLNPEHAADQLGVTVDDLREEEFCIKSIGNTLVILARDRRSSNPNKNSFVTTWAFSYLLDRYVGVRWLWPGELGTVVPKRATIRIPELNVRWQPPLVRRSFNLNVIPSSDPQDEKELVLWAAHHQVTGERVDYRFAHSFRKGQTNGDWWGRFHETRPDMLAKNPAGEADCPNGHPDRVKLCISNPAVTEEILRLWRAAGRPDFWDVTPNDGNCFCTCDGCRRLDQQYGGVTYSKEEIWTRPPHVSLTGRYVWFWNQLIRKMRQENPNVRIGVYFYSAYRDPPKHLRLEKGIVGEIVHGFDFTLWKAWQAAGAEEIGLRPNWWHMGANAPHLPLHTAGSYIEQARENGMRWIKMDSMLEYWATQGPYYYLVARLIARPDLSTEEIITEYCDAFGDASADIRRYLDYWEEYHRRVAYNIPAGGSLSQNPDGLYERVCREHWGTILHPLSGHWKTLPWIYTPDVLARGRAILDDAEAKAGDEATRLRIQFLRDGLTQVEKTIAVLKASKSDREIPIRALHEFSRVARSQYGYWGSDGLWIMQHWGVIGKEFDLEGL